MDEISSQDSIVTKVINEDEFEAFLQVIRNGKIEHWATVAEALGVHQNTITRWKKDPRAQKAIADGIENAISQMEKVGARDWKMWREKLKLLGVKDESSQTQVAVGVNVPININNPEADYDRLAEKVIGLVERLKSAGVSQDATGSGGTGQTSSGGGGSESKSGLPFLCEEILPNS